MGNIKNRAKKNKRLSNNWRKIIATRSVEESFLFKKGDANFPTHRKKKSKNSLEPEEICFGLSICQNDDKHENVTDSESENFSEVSGKFVK